MAGITYPLMAADVFEMGPTLIDLNCRSDVRDTVPVGWGHRPLGSEAYTIP